MDIWKQEINDETKQTLPNSLEDKSKDLIELLKLMDIRTYVEKKLAEASLEDEDGILGASVNIKTKKQLSPKFMVDGSALVNKEGLPRTDINTNQLTLEDADELQEALEPIQENKELSLKSMECGNKEGLPETDLSTNQLISGNGDDIQGECIPENTQLSPKYIVDESTNLVHEIPRTNLNTNQLITKKHAVNTNKENDPPKHPSADDLVESLIQELNQEPSNQLLRKVSSLGINAVYDSLLKTNVFKSLLQSHINDKKAKKIIKRCLDKHNKNLKTAKMKDAKQLSVISTEITGKNEENQNTYSKSSFPYAVKRSDLYEKLPIKDRNNLDCDTLNPKSPKKTLRSFSARGQSVVTNHSPSRSVSRQRSLSTSPCYKSRLKRHQSPSSYGSQARIRRNSSSGSRLSQRSLSSRKRSSPHYKSCFKRQSPCRYGSQSKNRKSSSPDSRSCQGSLTPNKHSSPYYRSCLKRPQTSSHYRSPSRKRRHSHSRSRSRRRSQSSCKHLSPYNRSCSRKHQSPSHYEGHSRKIRHSRSRSRSCRRSQSSSKHLSPYHRTSSRKHQSPSHSRKMRRSRSRSRSRRRSQSSSKHLSPYHRSCSRKHPSPSHYRSSSRNKRHSRSRSRSHMSISSSKHAISHQKSYSKRHQSHSRSPSYNRIQSKHRKCSSSRSVSQRSSSSKLLGSYHHSQTRRHSAASSRTHRSPTSKKYSSSHHESWPHSRKRDSHSSPCGSQMNTNGHFHSRSRSRSSRSRSRISRSTSHSSRSQSILLSYQKDSKTSRFHSKCDSKYVASSRCGLPSHHKSFQGSKSSCPISPSHFKKENLYSSQSFSYDQSSFQALKVPYSPSLSKNHPNQYKNTTEGKNTYIKQELNSEEKPMLQKCPVPGLDLFVYKAEFGTNTDVTTNMFNDDPDHPFFVDPEGADLYREKCRLGLQPVQALHELCQRCEWKLPTYYSIKSENGYNISMMINDHRFVTKKTAQQKKLAKTETAKVVLQWLNIIEMS